MLCPYPHDRPASRRTPDGDTLSAISDLLHPDTVTGVLNEALRAVLARPSANTLAELERYRGLPMESLFPAPRRAPRVKVSTRWRLPGVVSEDLVFPSEHRPLGRSFRKRYESEYVETHTVYARRIRPSGAGRRPRLLYLHGYMQPESLVEELALFTTMALWLDVEVVQLQPPYHGRRTPRVARFGGELYWTADLVRSLEALRQNVLDARTLLDWMLDGDPRPVGVSGISLGGALAQVLTCLEPRFDFSIPLIAHMDLAALLADAPVLSSMRRELQGFGFGPEEFAKFVTELGWDSLRPLLPPERILLFAASQDRFFDPRVVEAMRRRWGDPEVRWYPCSHMGFIPRLPLVIAEMRRFLDGL